MEKISGIFFKIIKYVFILTIVVISIVPIIWVVLSSFKTNIEILNSAFKLPENFGFHNYVTAFKLSPIAKFYVNSLIVAVAGTGLNIIAIGMAAYVCARFEFKAKGLILSIYSISLLIPAAALLFPLYLTISKMGMINMLPGLILVYAGLGLPTTLFILRSYFLTIPKELEEAAYLDGAGFIRTFAQIILPMSRPGIGTAAVLQFMLCWNEFQFALVLTTGNSSRTLPLALVYFTSLFSSDLGALFAATTVIIMPSILFYILLQKQMVSGLTAGAVKG